MGRRKARLRLWFVPLLVLVTANVTLFGSMAFGLDVEGVRVVRGLAADAHLDYGLGLVKGFTRLTDAFVDQVLGTVSGSERPRTAAPAGEQHREISGGAPLRSRSGSQVVTHRFTNGDPDAAFAIEHVPFTARTDTGGLSTRANSPPDCVPAGVAAWYRYTPKGRESLFANTFGTKYATVLGVFSGVNPSSLHRVTCSAPSPTGNAQAGFQGEAGTTYYFQITGPAGGGPLVFTLTRLGVTRRVSVGPDGAEPNDVSGTPAPSADGRYIAFASRATNLAGPAATCVSTNPHCQEIYVRDTVAGTTTLVSISDSGAPGDGDALDPAISADGRYIAFASTAHNLVNASDAGTGAASGQIYLRDRLNGTTELVSRSSTGAVGDSSSQQPSISGDGRFVEFNSFASNLRPNGGVPCVVCISGGATGSQLQVYVRDRLHATTALASVGTSGDAPNNAAFDGTISTDGRHVAFNSIATNIIPGVTGSQVYEKDLSTGTVTLVTRAFNGGQGSGSSQFPMSLSADGNSVAFISMASNLVPGDTNGKVDYFVRDIAQGRTSRVSVTSSGAQVDNGDPVSSCSQQCLESQITVDVDISDDGHYVAFNSSASNLVDNDTNGVVDVFVHDMVTGATIRTSIGSDGSQGAGPSTAPALSADGGTIAFESTASAFAGDDRNSVDDAFTHDNELTL